MISIMRLLQSYEYHVEDSGVLYEGDCLDVMAAMEPESVDTVLTDPPYGLEFMGKDWDKLNLNVPFSQKEKGGLGGHKHHIRFGNDGRAMQEWHYKWAIEALRVAKPGAMLMAFGGTRTFHRLTCAIEDAGWQIRDCLMWLYGQGFPKSADISKQLDLQEKNRWLNIHKAIDNMPKLTILEAWKEYSKTAKRAGIQFQKSETGIGIAMGENDFVPDPVLLSINPERSNASAIIAELSLREVPRMPEDHIVSAQGNAEVITGQSRNHVKFAGKLSESQEAFQSIATFIVRCNVKELLNGKTEQTIKAVEALMIWLGKTKSSKKQGTIALCAVLTENLKLIILNQSETFRNLDTIQKTEIVSATNVTITESTAASLISSTVDTLRHKAIDKAAGAERRKIGVSLHSANRTAGGMFVSDDEGDRIETAPATPAAQLWDGWGTGLKPAWEPIILAMKPLDGTFANNALEHGVAGLHIDGGRIPSDGNVAKTSRSHRTPQEGWDRPWRHDIRASNKIYEAKLEGNRKAIAQGRYPANLILDGEAAAALDEQAGVLTSGKPCGQRKANHHWDCYVERGTELTGFGDSGGASRFFYTAKASRKERGADNFHPTVKPLKLMEYLCKLTATPTGGIILDPFAGSGTTGVAAKQTGRKFILIEKEAEFCEIAKNRLQPEDELKLAHMG